MHAIWIDPNNSDHMLIGNDGGVYQSYDGSKTWVFQQNLPVGLFYHVGYDKAQPYSVCGGMQDNYDWCGPSRSRQQQGIFNHEWFQVEGGDGFEAIPDRRDSRIVYSESQDGNMQRKNKVTGESKNIRPTAQNVAGAKQGETYRFHWDTPMMLSPHDPGTLVVAANKVFVSHDRGDSWTAISPDLTKQGNRDTIVTMGLKGSDIHISRDDGMSQWPTIVALAESPKQAGLYWAGTEDGNVQMSRDGKDVDERDEEHPGFPGGRRLRQRSRSVCIRRGDGVCHGGQPSLERLRAIHLGEQRFRRDVPFDRRQPHGRKRSHAHGRQAQPRRALHRHGDAASSCRSIAASRWQRLKANFPNVRVDEITIHPRDNAMLIATHGRAIWILDHLEPIQEYSAAQTAASDVCSSRRDPRSSGRRRTIATTSSGDTSTSSARIRRTKR